MIALTFIACLAWSGQCEEFRFSMGPEVTMLQCNIGIGTQTRIANWAVTRPGWRVVRYRCINGEEERT